jgi:hypothetical protein
MRRAIASRLLPACACRARLQHILCSNKYAFPGDEQAFNFVFATSRDSSHLLAGYDTPPRGEFLVSSFTAAMHRKDAMSGHVLPVIFSGASASRSTNLTRRNSTVGLFGPKWDSPCN